MLTRDGIKLVKSDRDKLWGYHQLDQDRRLITAIREASIKSVIKPASLNSIAFFRIHSRGARKVRELTNNDLEALRRHIEDRKLD